jgi:hypothetical protein
MWQEGKDFFRTMRTRRQISAKAQAASSSAA